MTRLKKTAAPLALLLSFVCGGIAFGQEEAEFEPRPGIGELNGRHRVELGLGYFATGGSTVESNVGGVTSSVGLDNFSVALGYSYWLRPDLAATLSMSVLDSAVETGVSRGVSNEVRGVVSVLAGLRHDFLGGSERPVLRPYLTVGLGPYFGSLVQSRTTRSGVGTGTRTVAAFGGQVGAGLDVQLSRLVMLGGRIGYDFMTDFSSPVGAGKDNYSGFHARLSVSFLFGKGSDPRN